MSARPLTSFLGQLRRRVLCIGAAAGFGWGLVAAALCLLIAVWLDLMLDFPPALRIAALVTAACTAVGMLAAMVWSGLRRSRPALLARRLDTAGGTSGQILSGVELSAFTPAHHHSRDPALTGALAEMGVERAERLAAGIPVALAAPAKPVARAFAVFGGLIVTVLLLAVLMPRLAATEWRRFVNPFDDEPPFSLVAFVIEPGDATVLYGEGLDIRATVTGPAVDDLELVLRTAGGDAQGVEDVVPMFAEPGGAWRASLSNLTAPTRYFVRARQARSRGFAIGVTTVPQFRDVRFRISPPAYTRAADYQGPLPQGGIAGLAGTRVQLWATSNRPLSGGSLTYAVGEDHRELELKPTGDGHEVTGTLEIIDSGRIELTIVDDEGQPSTEPWSAPVVRLEDERPFVRILQPPAMSLATPTAVIPVVIAAEDDYGISRLQLFRSLNDSRPLPLDIAVPDPPAARTQNVEYLPLREYGLEPGDEIKLFARVEDNDPYAQTGAASAGGFGKGSESSVVLVRIIAQEEYDRMRRTRDGLEMLMAKYQQARRRMESLAQEMETLQKKLEEQPGDGALQEELREELQQLAQRMQEEIEALRKLQESELPFELDQELAKELQEMQDSLQRLVQQTESLAKNEQATNRDAQQELAEMIRRLSEQRERFDAEAMEPLEVTAAVVQLAQCESRFVELYRRQRDLADRLASLRGRDREDDPALKARMRDLEAEQQQIRAELGQLLDDIEERAARLPDDEALEELRQSALEFAAAVRESGASEAMSESEAGLAEFSGTRGHAGAKRAADILEKFLGQCEGMGLAGGSQACRRFSPGLGNSMARTLQQLMPGMGSGPGMGMGGGGSGGYSARRDSLQNVGLYGSTPVMDMMAGNAAGMSDQNAADGRGGFSRPLGGGSESLYGVTGNLQAAGAGEAAVPLPYRRKVGRYFQRIADEIGSE